MATHSSVLAWESHGWRGLGATVPGGAKSWTRRSDRTAQENEPSQTGHEDNSPGEGRDDGAAGCDAPLLPQTHQKHTLKSSPCVQ